MLLKVEKAKSKYSLSEVYRLVAGTYYLEIGGKNNLVGLYTVFTNFMNGNLKNINPLFKLSFNDAFFYIKYTPSNKFLGIKREEVETLYELIQAEVCK